MIRIENITKEYGERTLFKDVTYHFPEGEKIAVVGPNGAGKSTLLKIISGEVEQTSGKILIPDRCRMSALAQEPGHNPATTVIGEGMLGAKRINAAHLLMEKAQEAMERDSSTANVEAYISAEQLYRDLGGYSLLAEMRMMLTGLGFKQADFEKNPKALSGGWRMRLELAKTLIDKPDFLILDEPTNHLDLPSLVWVESFLKKFPGTLVFVSHDRDLLNRTATYVLDLSTRNATAYRGNYDEFLRQKEERRALAGNTFSQMEKQKEHLQDFVDRFGAKASKARQAQARVKMIAKIEEEQEKFAPEANAAHVRIKLPLPLPSARTVFEVKGGSIGYNEASPLCTKMNLLLEKGMRVAIVGANGIGKSTFLKTIVGEIPGLSGTFEKGMKTTSAYFAQESLDFLELDRSIFDNIRQVSDQLGDAEIRSLAGCFLFSGDNVFKPVRVLSGGEKSRVGLACVLAEKANFLVLDEPTNHLDMETVDRLAVALASYEGSLIFVSHNRRFINTIATHIFAMGTDGTSALFEGGLDDYAELAKTAGLRNVLDANGSLTEADPSLNSATGPAKTAKNAVTEKIKKNVDDPSKRKAKLKKIEVELENLGVELTRLENLRVQIKPTDYQGLQANLDASDKLTLSIKALEEEWLELSSL